MTHIPFPPHPVLNEPNASLMSIFKQTIEYHPFNLVAMIIFALAIIHTLFAYQITRYAQQREKRWDEEHHPAHDKRAKYSFFIENLYFLGEVEIVFAIWVIPLFLCIVFYWDLDTALSYLNSLHYAEPVFVIAIMILASTKPIIDFARGTLRVIAKIFREKIFVWWIVILTLCPLFGSFITEPGAMILGALMLKNQFFKYKPSIKLSYATLGLLFVNISIGGVLTNFAAPPVLMVARKWGWTNSFMFYNFGLKSMVSIAITTLVYYLVFIKEFQDLDRKKSSESNKEVAQISAPLWVTFTHVMFLIALIFFEQYIIVIVGLLFLSIGFHRATTPYQSTLHLKGPILVGAFLAGLVIHGGLHGWWIEPIITRLSSVPMIMVSTILTSFNDNALITYLASQIPDLASNLKYAVVSGAVAGGGLTVIANAPNPAGQLLLKEHFDGGISPLGLFLGALFPTCMILVVSYIWLVFVK